MELLCSLERLNLDVNFDINEQIDLCREQDKDISEICIKNLDMENEDLSYLSFETVIFDNCNLIGCDFNKTSFSNVAFKNCNLSNSTFSDSYFSKVEMISSKLIGSIFSDSIIKFTLLSNCLYSYKGQKLAV